MTLRELDKQYRAWAFDDTGSSYDAETVEPLVAVSVEYGDIARALALRALSAMIAAAEKEMGAI